MRPVTTFGLSLAASIREPLSRIANLVAEAEGSGFAYAFVIDSQMAFKDVYVTLAVCAATWLLALLRLTEAPALRSKVPRSTQVFCAQCWLTTRCRVWPLPSLIT